MEFIWTRENFALDEQNFFYEMNPDGSVRRKLQAAFVFEYWEVYALPCSDGIFYAVIGLHGGTRFCWKKQSRLSTIILHFVAVGRDLAYRAIGGHWILLSVLDGKCRNILPSLIKNNDNPAMFVSALSFDGRILKVHVKAVRFYDEDLLFEQTQTGYRLLQNKKTEHTQRFNVR